ncbi:MAG: thiamine pyrophosphate-dependent enzyme, partial [Acidimicrobiales bacterium]
ALTASDLVLVVDCDVPWVPTQCAPPDRARIVQIDPDPAKAGMPLWAYPVDRSYQAEGETAIRQLLAALTRGLPERPRLLEACARRVAGHAGATWLAGGERQGSQPDRARPPIRGDTRSGVELHELLENLDHVLGPDDIVVEEAVTNREAVRAGLARLRPGTRYGAGAPGLGWGLGGALGVKMAAPDQRVVTVCGDGSFLFGSPTSALTMAAACRAPFGVVIIDNGGYRASRLPVYALFPQGYSVTAGDAVGTRFATAPDYVKLAEACHAHAERVETLDALPAALQQMMKSLDAGKVSLLDVIVNQD